MTRRTWMVTGASRGLGRAIAVAALEAGDVVAATARTLSDLSPLCDAYGDNVLPLRLDISDRGAVLAGTRQVLARFGRVDVLVNNAGYGLAGAVEEVTEEQARRQLDVNVLGALWCTQAVLPAMRRQRSGHIFQMSSLGGITAMPDTGLYHASKWALEGLSEALAREVEAFGIHVTLIEPGPFRTDWNGTSMVRAAPLAAYDGVLRERRQALSGQFAHTQPGDPHKAAQAILAMLSEANPPLRLLLGKLAADIAPRTYRQRLAEWSRWDNLTRSSDFD